MANAKDVKSPRVVVVTGDVTMDWNFQRLRSSQTSSTVWNANDITRVNWQRGGAALLADLVEAVVNDLPDTSSYTVHQTAAPKDQPLASDPRFHRSYAMWSPYSYDRASSRWRVSEFLGLDAGKVGAENWARVVGDTENADLIVLDDAALGFRSSPKLWPRAMSSQGRRPWIVLKMAKPVADGNLWEELH